MEINWYNDLGKEKKFCKPPPATAPPRISVGFMCWGQCDGDLSGGGYLVDQLKINFSKKRKKTFHESKMLMARLTRHSRARPIQPMYKAGELGHGPGR